MTLYDVLGVAPGATKVELRRAYAAQARVHHPDAGGGAEAMAAVNEAWAVLSDPVRRRAYDRGLGVVAPADPERRRDREEAFEADADDEDLLDARPLSPPRRAGPLPFIPPGLFALSIIVGSVAFAVDSPPLLGVAVVLFVLSCVSIAVVAMWILRSSIRR